MLVRANSNSAVEGALAVPVDVARHEASLGRTLYGGCVPFVGRIAEVLLYERAVSDAELVEIEGYLQGRYGCCTD